MRLKGRNDLAHLGGVGFLGLLEFLLGDGFFHAQDFAGAVGHLPDGQGGEGGVDLLAQFFLITAKPAMFVANVAEDGFESNPFLDRLKAYATAQNAPVVVICAKMEAEMADMSDEDKQMFLSEIGQQEPGLNRLIRAAFKLLGLQTYFTAGVKEVRAWTIHVGDTGPQAAGVIHTDFERGFIRAQTISFQDYITYKGETGAKEAGKMRSEGKEYVVKDGDVLNFLFNV